MLEKIKRQAKILSKEVSKSYNQCLDISSRLNGYVNWHEAQTVEKRVPLPGWEIRCTDPAVVEVSSRLTDSKKFITEEGTVEIDNIKWMSDADFWKIVDWMNWEKLSTEKTDKRKFHEKMFDIFGEDICLQVQAIYRRKYKTLEEIMHNYDSANEAHVSDDSLWDLTAHIVGLGKQEYIENIKNPQKTIERGRNRDFVENFGYYLPNKTQIEEIRKTQKCPLDRANDALVDILQNGLDYCVHLKEFSEEEPIELCNYLAKRAGGAVRNNQVFSSNIKPTVKIKHWWFVLENAKIHDSVIEEWPEVFKVNRAS